MKENIKMVVAGLFTFPMAVLFFIFYAHIVSLLDPILTFVLGGGLVLALIVVVITFLLNMKDFVVSIFKDDDTRDKRGFKKHF